MILSISSVASTSAQNQDFEWYIYKGTPFTATGSTARVQVKEGMRVGIRPVARSKDYYIVTEDAPKKLFKINRQRATKIAANGKRIKRVILQGDQPTEKTREILEDAATQKFDAPRFKPLGTVRNEAFGRSTDEAFGVDTKNYQWRVVRDPEYLVQTNKRPIKLRRGDKIGMRFGRPSQGGKLVDLNGMYETISTAEYDRIASDLPVMPKGRWPQTIVTPEMIKEYQLNKERQRVRERNDKEKEQRAQDAAERNAAREAKQKREEEQKQRRILDAKENNEIVQQVAEVARQETAKVEQTKEERRAKAGLKDEDLRSVKAGKMKPLEESLDEEEVDDDADFGDDIEGEVTRTSETEKEERAADNSTEKLKVAARKKAEENSLRMADAYKAAREAAADDADELAALKDEFNADGRTLKAADTSDEDKAAIIAKWEAKTSEESEPEEEEDPEAVQGEEEEDPEAGGEEEEEDPDADPDAEDEDPEADPDAEEEDPDAEGEDQDADGKEEGDEDFDEEDPDADPDAEDEEFEEDGDFDEEDPDADPDAEDEDHDADPDADPDAEFEEDEDFEPAVDADLDEMDDLEEPQLDEDSTDIANSLRDNPDAEDFDDDDAIHDLSDVDEEDIGAGKGEGEEEEPTPPKDAPKKPKPEPAADEEDPLDVEEEADDAADADLPKPAGVKDTQTVEEGDLLTFHDDTKLKRRFVLLEMKPSAQSDRIIEYTLWDFDSKPETYRMVRVNEARGQNILKFADKVGQVTPKEFTAAQDMQDSLELDKTAIKS